MNFQLIFTVQLATATSSRCTLVMTSFGIYKTESSSSWNQRLWTRLFLRLLLSRYWSVFIVLCSIQGIAMPWHPSIPFLLCMAITGNLSSEHTMTSNHVQGKTVYVWGRKNMRISSLFRCPCWFKWHHIVNQVQLSVFDSLVTLRTPTVRCAYDNLWQISFEEMIG